MSYRASTISSSVVVTLVKETCFMFMFCRGPGEILSEEAITTIHSKLKRTKEERLATAKASCVIYANSVF